MSEYTPTPVPSGTEPGTTARPDTTPRPATTIWGLIVIAVGLGVLATAAGLRFDAQAALIAVLAVAGGALIVASVRRARRQ